MPLFLGFTGIDQPYEAPENPDLVINTVGKTIRETVLVVIQMLENEVGCRSCNCLILPLTCIAYFLRFRASFLALSMTGSKSCTCQERS